MKTWVINQKVVFRDATPMQIYKMYLTAKDHAKFTGSEVKITDKVGAKFMAYDGYAQGENIELVPGKKIVQTWQAREAEWPAKHFSKLILKISDHKDGAELEMIHQGVPEQYANSIAGGWKDYYWKPMQEMIDAKKK